MVVAATIKAGHINRADTEEGMDKVGGPGRLRIQNKAMNAYIM